MTDFFWKLLENSLAACWVVLAVIAARFILQRAPRKLILAMWLLVVLRLVCPSFPASPASLQPSVQPISRTVYAYRSEHLPTPGFIPAPEYNNDDVSSSESVQKPESSSQGASVKYLACIPYAWASGTVGMILYGLWSYARIRRRTAVSCCIRENVFICDYIDTPFVLGLIHSRIYLPSALDEFEMPYVLAHERAHIRRGDPWWKLLGFLLLCLHWFNPMLWIAYRLFCRDIELACDEAVICRLDDHGKAAYSRALLHCSTSFSVPLGILAFGKSDVEKRIHRILHYQRRLFWLTIPGVILIGLIAVCFLTDPIQEDKSVSVQAESGFEQTEDSSEVVPQSPEIRYADKETAPMGTVPLPDEIVSVTVLGEKGISCLYDPFDLLKASALLTDIYNTDAVISGFDPNLDPDPWRTSMIAMETANAKSEFHFSSDCSIVWFPVSAEDCFAFSVNNPDAVKDFVSECMHSTLGKETNGAPTATIQEPLKWLSGLTFDAIRDVYLYRSTVYSGEDGSSVGESSFGWMWYKKAAALPDILNHITASSVSENASRRNNMQYRTFPQLTALFTRGSGGSLRFIDDANAIAAIFRLDGNNVELVLSSEPEKLYDRTEPLLQDYTVWTIEDIAFKAYLETLIQEMPAILPTAGARYDWADPISVSNSRFSICLRPITGWHTEILDYSDDSEPFGIRIHPAEESSGWIYISAMPKGFQEEGIQCTQMELGFSGDYTMTVGYDIPIDPENYNFYDSVWRYLCYQHFSGEADFVVWNDAADNWLLKHMDAIMDMLTFAEFRIDE